MKRFTIKEKIVCLGDDFTIRDEHGNDAYFVDGKVFTIRDVLLFQDMRGNTLATIRRKLLSLGTTYVIERDGHETTVHKHLFTLLRCTFSVDVPGPNDLEAVGSLLDHEYEFRDTSGRVAARVSKAWLALRDCYGVEVAPGVDEVLILASVIVIDRCCHEERR